MIWRSVAKALLRALLLLGAILAIVAVLGALIQLLPASS
jgi:hypothetical protein